MWKKWNLWESYWSSNDSSLSISQFPSLSDKDTKHTLESEDFCGMCCSSRYDISEPFILVDCTVAYHFRVPVLWAFKPAIAFCKFPAWILVR